MSCCDCYGNNVLFLTYNSNDVILSYIRCLNLQIIGINLGFVGNLVIMSVNGDKIPVGFQLVFGNIVINPNITALLD